MGEAACHRHQAQLVVDLGNARDTAGYAFGIAAFLVVHHDATQGHQAGFVKDWISTRSQLLEAGFSSIESTWGPVHST